MADVPTGAAPGRARAAGADRPLRARDRASRGGREAAARSVSRGSGSARSPAGIAIGVGCHARRRRQPRQARRPSSSAAARRRDARRRSLVAPTARKVVVPLPFLATHVELDDVVRDLDPPGDVAAFDVPARGRYAPPRQRRSPSTARAPMASSASRTALRDPRPTATPSSLPEPTTPEPRPPSGAARRARSARCTTASPSSDESPRELLVFGPRRCRVQRRRRPPSAVRRPRAAPAAPIDNGAAVCDGPHVLRRSISLPERQRGSSSRTAPTTLPEAGVHPAEAGPDASDDRRLHRRSRRERTADRAASTSSSPTARSGPRLACGGTADCCGCQDLYVCSNGGWVPWGECTDAGIAPGAQ